jgi:phospholipase/carboxylesterase
MQTAETVSAAVIWLHGLGADGSDFAGIAPELQLPPALGIRFIFPHAPFRAVSINNGYVMRAWYDMAPTEREYYRQDAGHIAESVEIVHGLIEGECARGIPAERIVIAGFSQGGVMTAHSALRFRRRLAGAVVLSAPVPYLDQLVAETAPANAALPMFIGHGRRDPIAPFVFGEQARDRLSSIGHPVDWHAYDMEHSVCWEEIAAIGKFLTRILQ